MQEPRFTHRAKIYGFNCYFNEDTMEVKGTNFFNEMMIELFIKIEQVKPINDGFVIFKGERLEETHKINRA